MLPFVSLKHTLKQTVAALQPAASAVQGSVLVVGISSDISSVTAELVACSIQEAQAGGARLVVYEFVRGSQRDALLSRLLPEISCRLSQASNIELFLRVAARVSFSIREL